MSLRPSHILKQSFIKQLSLQNQLFQLIIIPSNFVASNVLNRFSIHTFSMFERKWTCELWTNLKICVELPTVWFGVVIYKTILKKLAYQL